MTTELQKIEAEALEKIKNAADPVQLQELEVKYLGRKGDLTEMMHKLKDLSDEEKRTFGPACNRVKNKLLEHFAARRQALERIEIEKNLTTDFFDLTAPGKEPEIGHIHPLSQIQFEVENIFSDMGFTVVDGPEVESEYYNFEGLNIPSDHPARDMQDTFFIKDCEDKKHGRLVLRTQTSPIQIRTMEKFGAPLRIIAPGRTFRNEATDASHDHTFHQIEGLLVDKDISLATLKGIMTEFLGRLFGKPVKVRFRPGYFPFVEPGLELDFSCLICNEKAAASANEPAGWNSWAPEWSIPTSLRPGALTPQNTKAGLSASDLNAWPSCATASKTSAFSTAATCAFWNNFNPYHDT